MWNGRWRNERTFGILRHMAGNAIHYDIGNRKRGDVVEVTLTRGANVRLLDSTNFSRYGAGKITGTSAAWRRPLQSGSAYRPAVTGTSRWTCRGSRVLRGRA
jgi:hypothetical protein